MNNKENKNMERITGLDEDGAVGTTAPGPSVPEEEIQGELSNADKIKSDLKVLHCFISKK